MSQCIPPGWGTGPWGITPWGGEPSSFGGPLPTTDLFDLYCFGPCGPMAGILSHIEVVVIENGLQFTGDGLTEDLVIESGGVASTDAAVLTINTQVPEKFTAEWTTFLTTLPPNFSTLDSNHVFFGIFDASGPVVGLFLSRAGITYSGSVHFEAGHLVLDGPFQPLPGSANIVTEGDYFTFRVAADFSGRVVYVYITRTADLHNIGHQLRFILPALAASSMTLVPPDQTIVSVRGTASLPSKISLDDICLGTGLLIPNIMPFADAGIDQALQRCTVAALDGTKSFDPEGAPLAYRWRLVDAPLTSQYVFQSLDGATLPQTVATGFTDRFYSPSLGVLHDADPFAHGDVLVARGVVYVIDGVGADLSGFFVRTEGYLVPDSLAGAAFHVLRQRGISGRTTAKPTFYPDASGLYKFDLTVFDGNLFSEPAVTVLNVTESPLARGVIPDLRFLWNYLSDFWRLVEDTERIEVYWSGLAQVAAAELLNLWQIDYSKSLRDIQRTVQRRWLHYDFLMVESLPELSSVRAVYSGIESVDIPAEGFDSRVDLSLDIPARSLATLSFSGGSNRTAAALKAALQARLNLVDSGIRVALLSSRDGSFRLRIDAPFAMTVAPSTIASLMPVGLQNGLLEGAGSAMSSRAYKVDRSLENLGLVQGDFLVLAGSAYRIGRIIDDASDPWPFQRVSLLDDIPVPAPTTWAISGQVTSPSIDFAAGLVAPGDVVTVEIIEASSGSLVTVDVPALGTSAAASSTLAIDASSLGQYLVSADHSVFLQSVLRRTYLPLDPLVVDVPYLQEKIDAKNDEEVLRRNVDFFVERGRLRFVTGSSPEPDVWQYGKPPARMWAEVTYLDNRPTIEANFGIPAAFTLDDLSVLPSNVDYLSAVRGLWYAFFNGPTLFNLKAGTQILLGLPFAEEAGVIDEIRNDFSSSHGRLLVHDRSNPAIVRSYTYPASLRLEENPATKAPYEVGDTVELFAPLVAGTEVADWVKDPRWFLGYLQQGAFYEVEKFFRFLVRVDSVAFNLSALLFVQSFIRRIKPTYTLPLFVVRASIADTEISTTDAVSYSGTLHLSDLGVTMGALGMATMVDEARAAGGGWRSQFDTGPDPDAPRPTPPDSELVLFGADKNYLSPEDAIIANAAMPMPHFEPPFFTGGTPSLLPFLDGIFRSDLPLFNAAVGRIVFYDNHVLGIPSGPEGYRMGPDPVTSTLSANFDFCLLDIAGDAGTDSPDYELVIEMDGVDVVVHAFTAPGGAMLGFDISLALVPGAVLRARVRPQGAGVRRPFWHQITVQLFQKVTWALDTPMAAGMYAAVVAL